MVELTGIMANVHQRHNQVKAALGDEEIANELGPAIALSFGATGETVTRQVHKVHVVGLEEIDIARLTRRTRNLDQGSLRPKKLVHDGRLAHI